MLLKYIRADITRLELYQLAESVVEIVATRQTSSSTNPKTLEYLLEFDRGFSVKSMWVDYTSLERLSKMREDLLPHLSPTWEAFELPRAHPARSVASARGVPGSRSGKRFTTVKSPAKRWRDDLAKQPRAKPAKPSQQNSSRTIKQLWSLLAESTMGRRISFESYGICHHCRKVKPLNSHLVACRYSSVRNGFIVPNCLTVNGCTVYNSSFAFTVADVSGSHLQEILKWEKTPGYSVGNIRCHCYFCKECLKQNYSVRSKDVGKDWLCPFCTVRRG